jgi:hypothetical protein
VAVSGVAAATPAEGDAPSEFLSELLAPDRLPAVMTARRVALIVAISLLACDQDKPKPPIFGKAIEPPAGMAAIRPGMSEAEVKAKVPDLKIGGGLTEGLLVKATARKDATVAVLLDDHRMVSSLRVVIFEKERDLVDMLTKSWGPPAATAGKTTWLDEKGAWRAEVDCERGSSVCHVDFRGYRPFKAALLGKHPGPLAPLVAKGGDVSVAEAEAAGFKVGTPDAYEIADGVKGSFGSEGKLISSILLYLPEAARETIHQAWGQPVQVKRVTGTEEMWHHPETRWRAILAKDSARGGLQLWIKRYTPYLDFLGSGAEVAALPSSLLTKTPDQLLAAIPDARKGSFDGDFNLYLPATDWERIFTKGSLWLGHNIWFNLDYGPRKDEMFEQLKKKWGEPKPFVDKLANNKWLFREADPRIEVQDIEHSWRIYIRLEPDEPDKAPRPRKRKK